MPNALQAGAQPPIPNPQVNALTSGGGAPSPQPGAGAPDAGGAAPTPTHVQTVASLAHFHAIQSELDGLLKNPDLGKSSIKSAIIEGATKLVAQRILTPGDAVAQLGQVPDDPLGQKKWVMSTLQQAFQASNAVLAHRQAAVASGAAPPEDPNAAYSADNHIGHMAGVMAHYRGAQG
jgi:hypothetical protein